MTIGRPRKGQKRYGIELPSEIGLHRVEVEAGRSAQSTLLGKSDITYESIYLSNDLIELLELSPDEIMDKLTPSKATQLALPIIGN